MLGARVSYVSSRFNHEDSETAMTRKNSSAGTKNFLQTTLSIMRSARAYTGIITNAISSVGNFVLSIALARAIGISELGEFGIAFALYVFFAGLSRALVCEPLLAARPEGTDFSAGSSRVSLIGTLAGIIVTIVGFAFSLPYITVVGIALHGLLIFDYSKSMNLAIFNKNLALTQEALWTVVSVIVGGLIHLGSITGLQGFLLWALSGATIGYASLLYQSLAVKPKWNQKQTETRNSLAFGGDYIIGSGSSQVSFNLVGLVAGLSAVGSLRAGGTLLGPVSIVVGSARTLAIPYLSRGLVYGRRATAARALASTAIIGVFSLPVLAFVAYLPTELGQMLLGDNWLHAEPVLPYLALEMASIALATVPFAGFRALQAGKITVIIRGILAVFRVTTVVVAAISGGLIAAAIAMALTSCVGTLVWWLGYILQLNRKWNSKNE